MKYSARILAAHLLGSAPVLEPGVPVVGEPVSSESVETCCLGIAPRYALAEALGTVRVFLRSAEWKERLEGVMMVVGEEALRGEVSVLERGLGLL